MLFVAAPSASKLNVPYNGNALISNLVVETVSSPVTHAAPETKSVPPGGCGMEFIFVTNPGAIDPATTKYFSLHHAATIPPLPFLPTFKFAAIHALEHRGSVVAVAAAHVRPHFTFAGDVELNACAISTSVRLLHFPVVLTLVHVDGPHVTTDDFAAPLTLASSRDEQSLVNAYVCEIASYVTDARASVSADAIEARDRRETFARRRRPRARRAIAIAT